MLCGALLMASIVGIAFWQWLTPKTAQSAAASQELGVVEFLSPRFKREATNSSAIDKLYYSTVVGNERIFNFPEHSIGQIGFDKYYKHKQLLSIAHLQGLRALNLPYTDVSSECINTLDQLSALEQLNIGFTKVTGKGVASLHRFDKLTELSVADMPGVKHLLARLSGASQLERLELQGCDLEKDNLAPIYKLLGP